MGKLGSVKWVVMRRAQRSSCQTSDALECNIDIYLDGIVSASLRKRVTLPVVTGNVGNESLKKGISTNAATGIIARMKHLYLPRSNVVLRGCCDLHPKDSVSGWLRWSEVPLADDKPVKFMPVYVVLDSTVVAAGDHLGGSDSTGRGPVFDATAQVDGPEDQDVMSIRNGCPGTAVCCT
jgi:hypothetical protein